MEKKNILVICKYNRFRSKIVEAYINKNCKNIRVRSRGIIQGKMNRNSLEISIPKEFNLNIASEPIGVKYIDLEWADIILVPAGNVPKNLFDSRRLKREIIQWNIADVYPDTPEDKIRKIVLELIDKTDDFCKKISRTSQYKDQR